MQERTPRASDLSVRLALRKVGYKERASGLPVSAGVYPVVDVSGTGQLFDASYQESAAQSCAGSGDRISLTVPIGYLWIVRFIHFDVQTAGTTTGNAGFTLLSPEGNRMYIAEEWSSPSDVRFGRGHQFVPAIVIPTAWSLSVDFRTGMGGSATGRVACYADQLQLS